MAGQAEHGVRDRILIAAATMLGEDVTARLSVRAIAQRAGVSTGSLRHLFPSQQALMDEVAAGIVGLVGSDEVINDHTRPAQDRLLTCLKQVLAATGTGDQARQTWRTTLAAYISSTPGVDSAQTYQALAGAGRRRIEQWLSALVEEGAIPPGDLEQRARFLSTVLDGLAVERALPTDAASLAAEDRTLRMAVAAVRITGPH